MSLLCYVSCSSCPSPFVLERDKKGRTYNWCLFHFRDERFEIRKYEMLVCDSELIEVVDPMT